MPFLKMRYMNYILILSININWCLTQKDFYYIFSNNVALEKITYNVIFTAYIHVIHKDYFDSFIRRAISVADGACLNQSDGFNCRLKEHRQIQR